MEKNYTKRELQTLELNRLICKLKIPQPEAHISFFVNRSSLPGMDRGILFGRLVLLFFFVIISILKKHCPKWSKISGKNIIFLDSKTPNYWCKNCEFLENDTCNYKKEPKQRKFEELK